MIKDNINNKIKYLYLILTIGIVILHTRHFGMFNIKPLNDVDRFILSTYMKTAEQIGYISMVFFFFMSGFWFYKGLNSYKDIIKKWKRRIHTLLIPYLIWTVIIGTYQVCTSQITINFNNIFYHIFETPVTGPLWYILGLLILQLFAPIILSLMKNRKLLTMLFSIIIIYISLRSLNIIPNLLEFKDWWWYNNLIYYIPVYLIGSYIGMYHQDIIIKNEYNQKIYTYIGISLLIIVFIFWTYLITDIHYLNLIYAIISMIGLWFILKPKLFSKKLPDFLNCSFFLFALHKPILKPLTYQITKFILGNNAIFCLEALLIRSIELIIIFLFSAIIRKISSKIFFKKFYYYLTGGR